MTYTVKITTVHGEPAWEEEAPYIDRCNKTGQIIFYTDPYDWSNCRAYKWYTPNYGEMISIERKK